MMTDDELDLLASSYLDGETTPDEVARVDADPELRARVELLRSVGVTAPATPPGLAQAQLARAMALYRPGSAPGRGEADRREADEPVPGAEPVIDLTERRREREGRAARLRWLTSAAAVLVVGVGAVALINQIGGSEDAEMATADTSTESATDAAEVAPTADADTGAADMAQAEMAEESAGGESAGDGTAGNLADLDGGGAPAADDAASEGADEAADAEESLALEESEEDGAELSAERILRDLPESGFFPDEPVAQYNRLPTGEEMVGDLELPWRDEAAANCLEDFPPDDLFAGDEVEVIAHLPFEVTGGDAAGVYEALYVIVNGAEEVVIVLQAGSCAPVV
jgi:hypothetical protein